MASVKDVIEAFTGYAEGIAKDNSHGYSQNVRSLYNLDNPRSFDCSSLVLTAIYYAFKKYGITPTPKDFDCSYTGNMDGLLNCGFEVVATNQTGHSQMQRGDIELNKVYHVAMAVDGDNIVHARTSEGTTDTLDNSGNEIRVQPWYEYSHGWDVRLRFTGKGLNLDGKTEEAEETKEAGSDYMFKLSMVSFYEKGNHVLLLQEILKARGYMGLNGKELELDGECGVNTVYVINAYQTKRRAAGVELGTGGKNDGCCGSKMWADLIGL